MSSTFKPTIPNRRAAIHDTARRRRVMPGHGRSDHCPKSTLMHASSACTNPNLNEVFLRLQTAQGVEHHPLNKFDTHTQTPCASACPLSCLRTSCLDTYDIKVLAASTYMHKSKSAGMQISDPRFLLPECGTVHISYSASHDPQQPFTLYSQPPGDCDGQVLVSGLGLVTYGRLRWSGLGFRSWPSDLVPVWHRRQKTSRIYGSRFTSAQEDRKT